MQSALPPLLLNLKNGTSSGSEDLIFKQKGVLSPLIGEKISRAKTRLASSISISLDIGWKVVLWQMQQPFCKGLPLRAVRCLALRDCPFFEASSPWESLDDWHFRKLCKGHRSSFEFRIWQSSIHYWPFFFFLPIFPFLFKNQTIAKNKTKKAENPVFAAAEENLGRTHFMCITQPLIYSRWL